MKQIAFARKYLITEEGNIYSTQKGDIKELKQTTMKCGYKRVRLSCDTGDKKSFLVHRLVALTFISNPLELPQVNHKDGNKQNNHVSNLEWITAGDNQKHAYNIGLKTIPKGVNNGRCILNEKDVIDIYNALMEGSRIFDLAKEYDVEKSTISSIKIKKNWEYLLSELPDIPMRNKKESLSDATVHWICTQFANGKTVRDILKETRNDKLNYDNVKDIYRKKCFKRISDNYNW